jgi:hypothetical protein
MASRQYDISVMLLVLVALCCSVQLETEADFMVQQTFYPTSTTCSSPNSSTFLTLYPGNMCINYIDGTTFAKRSEKFNCQTLTDEVYAGFNCAGAPIETDNQSGCLKTTGDSSSQTVTCVEFPDGYVLSYDLFNNTACRDFRVTPGIGGIPAFVAMTHCYLSDEGTSYTFTPTTNGTIFKIFPNVNCTGNTNVLNQTFQFGKCDTNVNQVDQEFFGSGEAMKWRQGAVPGPTTSMASADNSVAFSFLMFVSVTMKLVIL